jgi:hypothetical protein
MNRNPNARDLAMRDPALGSLMGALGSPGSDFGDDFGSGGSSFGDDYGPAGFGADVGFGAERHGHHAHHAAKKAHHKERRMLLLDPNMHSDVKIERYTFSLNQVLTMTTGTTVAIYMDDQPDTALRPQRVLTNSPAPGVFLLTEIKVANVSVTVGNIEDAWFYAATSQGVILDMPTLSPANKAKVFGTFTGLVPSPYSSGQSYTFIVAFQGPSTMAAG